MTKDTLEKQEYIPYGIEWENEMNKLPKKELIRMIREIQAGTKDEKMVSVNTLKQAEGQVEGIINDFAGGIIDKSEALRLMGEYTGRIMNVFWNVAKEKFNENPELLKQ